MRYATQSLAIFLGLAAACGGVDPAEDPADPSPGLAAQGGPDEVDLQAARSRCWGGFLVSRSCKNRLGREVVRVNQMVNRWCTDTDTGKLTVVEHHHFWDLIGPGCGFKGWLQHRHSGGVGSNNWQGFIQGSFQCCPDGPGKPCQLYTPWIDARVRADGTRLHTESCG